jgi:hypothetical protein
MKRSRGRGRRQQSTGNRSFDSNGPDVRVRGTASQVYEKYTTLAHDALLSGDRVNAENLQQHAEHYFRIMLTQQPAPSSAAGANGTNGAEEDAGDASDNDTSSSGSDQDAEAPSQSGEPLVLVRGDTQASEDGAEDTRNDKSRRRGPLRRRRKEDKASSDAVVEAAGNVEEAVVETAGNVADANVEAPAATD